MKKPTVSDQTKKSLVKLAVEENEFIQHLIENGGELPLEMEQAMIQSRGEIATKIDSYSGFMKRLEMESERLNAKVKELRAVSSGLDRVREKLRDNIRFAMSTMNVTELRGEETRFKLSATKPALVLTEEIVGQKEFMKTVTELVPDKEKIEAALQLGVEIPGAKYEQRTALREYPCSPLLEG